MRSETMNWSGILKKEPTTMTDLENRITIEPEKCGGRPCIRGMRIRVTDVLDLLASGLSKEEVVKEMPDLEPADVIECLKRAGTGLV